HYVGDGRGVRPWDYSDLQCKRIDRAATDVLQIHFLLTLPAPVHPLFAFQHGPAVGNDDETTAYLYNRNGDSKEMQNVRSDEERGNQQDKTVQSDLVRQDAARRTRIL